MWRVCGCCAGHGRCQAPHTYARQPQIFRQIFSREHNWSWQVRRNVILRNIISCVYNNRLVLYIRLLRAVRYVRTTASVSRILYKYAINVFFSIQYLRKQFFFFNSYYRLIITILGTIESTALMRGHTRNIYEFYNRFSL